MISMRARYLLCLAVAGLMTAGTGPQALAQRGGQNYNVQTMNFDLWCQEEAGLPPERCDKRTPEDENTFEAYRAKVEQYEIPYLQRQDNNARLDRDILHHDPVDNPMKNDPAAQQQDPKQSPVKSPP